MPSAETIRRIKAKDVPFSETTMAAAELDRLVSSGVFDGLDPKYRKSEGFRSILRTHARLVSCQPGDIVCRKGDWSTTAFFILSGTVIVEIEPPGKGLPDEILGRRQTQRKSFFQSLAQLWSNHSLPEFRDTKGLHSLDERVASRQSGKDTRIYLQDVPGVVDRYRHRAMKAGELFGELAALGRTARTATVFAEGNAELLELRWQGLRDLSRRDPGFKQQVDQAYRRTALLAFLQNSPIFRHLAANEQAMTELVEEAQLETYGEYDRVSSFKDLIEEGNIHGLETEPLIAAEGEYPNSVVLIRSGLARVSERYHNGHRTITYLTPGQAFGYEEIVAGWQTSQAVPLKYSLRAIGYLNAIVVSTRLVEKYLLAREDRDAPSRTHAIRSPQFPLGRVRQDYIEFLVENRFVNGTATMLINLDRCTRCDDCVRACARAHDNNPRFLRSGPVHRNIMVANACMHCEDPVCMIECPTGAISRRLEEGEVTINAQTCIGCGTCANNCPYDAIRMVEIRNQDGAFLRDEKSNLPIPKATKCDLCVDQLGGPACQRACPHDALVRINVGDVESLVKWQSR